MSVRDDLVELRGMILNASTGRASLMVDLRNGIQELTQHLEQVAEAWSGSDLGYHARLYYHTLERPPLHRSFDIEWGGLRGLEGWDELTTDDLREMLEERAGVTFQELSAAADELLAVCRATREEVLVQMAPLAGAPGFDRETAVLAEIEQQACEPQQRRSLLPGGYRITRDMRAAAEGRQVPPHRTLGADLSNLEAKLEACERFGELALRLVRQALHRLENIESRPDPSEAPDSLAPVMNLARRFNDVALVLRERGRDRPALTMEDEYDVQYLLGALLKLHFDDVRVEEWAPSYAGGASRLDFLLKRERVVVEVKRTRDGLSDRAVGDQLIMDAARYAEHPDCDVLVCVVHDPDHRIKNPRGLEDDLSQLSREGLQVAVVIN